MRVEMLGHYLLLGVIVGLFLAGCAMGIPDYYPPPPRTEACQIFVRVDNGPWRCYARRKVLRDLCEATACSP